ncbi:MAG: TlpA family protein disulfide reductase [SAR202 cluster bacterium]|nr:TlpA family protein disulfide reductase [SAR202 cluster bacterium]
MECPRWLLPAIALFSTFLIVSAACDSEAPATAPTIAPVAASGQPAAAVGNRVGNRAPEFAIQLADGSSVSSEQLLKDGKPVFLFFWATWCSTCRGELERMKQVYPAFGDEVAFYAIGIDPSESISDLQDVARSRGYPWPGALPNSTMARDFNVLQQSTKIAIDSEGKIIYRDGYGVGSDDTWRSTLSTLTAGVR